MRAVGPVFSKFVHLVLAQPQWPLITVGAGCLTGARAIAGAGEHFSPMGRGEAGGFESGWGARVAPDVVVAPLSARGWGNRLGRTNALRKHKRVERTRQ